jgi:hypothetical protein
LRHYAETVTKLGMGGRVKADRIPGHSQWAIYLHQEEDPDGCL